MPAGKLILYPLMVQLLRDTISLASTKSSKAPHLRPRRPPMARTGILAPKYKYGDSVLLTRKYDLDVMNNCMDLE